MAVAGYDGMHLIAEALKKTGGSADGDKFIEAARGMKWVRPAGPISIDPATRDIVQTVYIRKVERSATSFRTSSSIRFRISRIRAKP